MTQLGRQRPLDKCHLHGHLLQHAQRALGLVQVVYLVLYRLSKIHIYCFIVHFILTSIPLTIRITSSA